MNAIPPIFDPAPRSVVGHAVDSSAGARWAALSEAGRVVAMLAGIEGERQAPEVPDFPAAASETWRRQHVERGIADLAAVMEPGIAALLAINARGADPRPAAMALWREFTAARGAILALLPGGSNGTPRRA